MKSMLLISDTAKKFGISRPTLLYYDQINLLTPSHNHENGYRYYTSQDLEKLELILILKESGMTLRKIKSFLDQDSREYSIKLLTVYDNLKVAHNFN